MLRHFLSLSLLWPALSASAAAPLPEALEAELASQSEVRVIVTLGPRPVAGRVDASRREQIADLQSRISRDLDPAHVRITHRYSGLGGLVAHVDAEGAAQLAAHPDVRGIAGEERMTVSMTESVPMVGGSAVRQAGYSGAGITVAVIDSGVQRTNADVSHALIDEHCFCALQTSGCCPDGSYEQVGIGSARDDQDHGTLVAGIMVSSGVSAGAGFVPDADLIGIRVLSADGIGALDGIAAAMDWLATAHPEVDIVNLSINSTTNRSSTPCDTLTPTTELIADAMAALRAQGTLTFVSSGNQGDSNQVAAPACVSAAVAVGSVYDDSLTSVDYTICEDSSPDPDDVACHSNGGARIDLLAPGAKIHAPSAAGGFQVGFGTSFAAPHAAGVAAQILSWNPSLSPAQVVGRMIATGKPVTDLRTGLVHPRIDAAAAVGLSSEDCTDGSDNDFDTLVDCEDPSCDGEAGPDGADCELGAELTCDDEADNDVDGDTDCGDPDCDGAFGPGGQLCQPDGESVCADDLDNDGDGLIDCIDPDCDGQLDLDGVSCEVGGELTCDDEGDNDDNGFVDCEDEACADAPNCQPIEEEPGGCGCDSGPLPVPALAVLAPLLVLVRRRRS